MRKELITILLLAMFLTLAAAAYADSDVMLSNMGAKLKLGIANTFTGWMEIPVQAYKGSKQGYFGDERNKLAGALAGTLEGICAGTGRTISGISDIVGFWALDPASNDGVGIPLEAQKAWEQGEVYDLLNPSLEEATITPVAKKLGRGLINTVFGVAEIPGQIVKGVKERSIDLGIIKGLWNFLSREISGLSDLVTACLPTPKDVTGNTFDKDWPWTDLCENIKK